MRGLMTMPYFQSDLNARNISEYLLSTMMAGAFGGALCSDQSEIAPKNMRGRLVSVQQFAIATGICVSYWMGYAFIGIDSSLSWRLPLGIPLIIALIYAIGIMLMPRSPRFLIHKHMDREALEVLAFIRGDGSLNHPDVLMEYVEIKQSIRFEETYGSKHFGRLFRKGWENHRKRLLLGMGVQIFQQLTGANALLYVFLDLIRCIMYVLNDFAVFTNCISGVINFAFSIPPMFIIDRWGRRPTLVYGSIFCCACTVVMAIVGQVTGITNRITAMLAVDELQAAHETEKLISVPYGEEGNSGSIAFLVVIYLFIACYALSWGPAGWIFPTELYSQDVRAQALGLTTAANWLFNYGVTQITPIMYTTIRWKTFVAYAVLCAVIAFAVQRYFPETMGKSLEEIDLIFSGNFNYYDLNVHHPQTAAAALHELDRAHARHSQAFETTTALSTRSDRPTDFVA
ncbi:general substrate transporter [Zychaea mexicana]|uniref:general substrate transporter n=1 Tax=Zychaea mexicana TaxID=64656 RepID=UPI0022FE2888|nr:general substrate transporter [Zychaea mexicana]KAI9488235.1 general substrate transporter [Zychaea mexicana]